MQSVVSVRGQTVIPKELREKLGIKPHTRLDWALKNGTLVAYPIPEDPVAALRGVLKDSGFTFEDFMRERNQERERERLKDEEEERRWRATSSTLQQ
jgi:AbrB family looped-hinge helix DNA binding protein